MWLVANNKMQTTNRTICFFHIDKVKNNFVGVDTSAKCFYSVDKVRNDFAGMDTSAKCWSSVDKGPAMQTWICASAKCFFSDDKGRNNFAGMGTSTKQFLCTVRQHNSKENTLKGCWSRQGKVTVEQGGWGWGWGGWQKFCHLWDLWHINI